LGAVRKPESICIRDVGVVGVGGVALMWTPTKPCCRRVISSGVAIIDANMQETKQRLFPRYKGGRVVAVVAVQCKADGWSVPHSMTKVELGEKVVI
jgi:hypothetical protein